MWSKGESAFTFSLLPPFLFLPAPVVVLGKVSTELGKKEGGGPVSGYCTGENKSPGESSCFLLKEDGGKGNQENQESSKERKKEGRDSPAVVRHQLPNVFQPTFFFMSNNNFPFSSHWLRRIKNLWDWLSAPRRRKSFSRSQPSQWILHLACLSVPNFHIINLPTLYTWAKDIISLPPGPGWARNGGFNDSFPSILSSAVSLVSPRGFTVTLSFIHEILTEMIPLRPVCLIGQELQQRQATLQK